jgi:hypothetical protein
MSRANAQVRFPNGTIKHGIYNGTVDVYWPYLFDTSEEAWSAWREYDTDKLDELTRYEAVDGPFHNVEIADDYGSGETYIGRATPRLIVSATNVDYMNSIKKSLPDWWAGLED